ncbi:MAG TPA: T9SS type A sorting domain-containing protein [Flavobacteriales bacterium]|nr:T9SS type A sorting domain-containing protein [Flavobacteriales bacterium]
MLSILSLRWSLVLVLIPALTVTMRAQSSGPLNPGTTANDAAVGVNNWSNTGNSAASDNSYATVSTKGISHYLKTTNFGFSIPTPSAIQGITVEVERNSTATVTVNDGWTTGTTKIISAGTNRCLVVAYAQENGFNSRDITAMTYGGRAMTQVAERISGTTGGFVARLEVWILLEVDIALAGSNTIVPTFGAYTATEYCDQFSVAVFANVDQSNPIGSLLTTGAMDPPNTANPHQLGATIAAVAGNMAINLVTEGNNTTPGVSIGGTNTYTINSGYTEGTDIYFANTSQATTGACFQTAHKAITTTGTERPSCTFNGTVNRWVMIGFTLNRMPEYDHRVQLVKNGVVGGTDKASSTAWPLADAYASYGGSSDTWGTNWTTADINSSTFGAAIAARVQNGNARVDHIRITVYHYSTLPVELLYFRAIPDGEEVRLDWATASEFDNDHFTIQRSRDGVDFQDLAHIPGAGYSQHTLFYDKQDPHPYAGLSYYRLIQTDTDGTFDISPVVAVRMDEHDWSFYPNPTEGNLTIFDPQARNLAVGVFDNSMRLVKSAALGSSDPTMLLTDLADGEYTILVRTGDHVHTSRIVKTSRSK